MNHDQLKLTAVTKEGTTVLSLTMMINEILWQNKEASFMEQAH